MQEQGETDSPEMCVCVCVSAPQDSNHLQDKKVKKNATKKHPPRDPISNAKGLSVD